MFGLRFEWPLKTGFTVDKINFESQNHLFPLSADYQNMISFEESDTIENMHN